MTKLYLSLNAEMPNELLAKDFCGVGMIRSEYLCRNINKYITVKECQEYIKGYLDNICDTFKNKEVWYRFTDLTSNEIDVLDGCDCNIVEKYHFIGIKGARRYIKFIDTFRIELNLIKEVYKKHSNLNIIIPYIKDIEEYKTLKEIIYQEGYQGKIGIMAEIPSVIFDIDRFIDEGVDSITIGLNDLTSLTLGTYRESEYHNKTHPIMIDIVKKISEKCKENNIIFSIAGYFSRKDIEKYKEIHVDRIIINYADLPNLDPKYKDLEELGMLKKIKEKTRKKRLGDNV